MKKGLIVLSLVAVFTGCGEDQQAQVSEGPAKNEELRLSSDQENKVSASTTVDKAALVNEAKETVKALGGPLKTQLQTAIKTGGPAQAVEVCQKIAPELARSVSADKGMNITRVSLKNRNPEMGVPSEWETAVLNDFEARKQAGEDPNTLSYAEVVDNQFRFMKAVPTGAVCLNCHGTELTPEVAAKLNELYPDDKATGFQEGDIRGAFVVTKNLAQ
jgi:hypothetical protein